MYDRASVISSSYKVTERTSLLSKDVSSAFKRQWPQHMAALLASSAAMGTGCVAGWSAPAIPYLQGNLGSLENTPITDSEASWVGSIITLGALVGAMPAGKLAGVYGRKMFLLSLTIPLILGWMIILNYYDNIMMLYLGRFICGMSFGAVTVAVPMYNNEIAEDNVRGVMGVYFDMMWCIGILFTYVMGAYTSFYWLTISCGLVPLFFFSTFIFMPESPVYLLVNNNKDAAAKSLRWLRSGKSEKSRKHHKTYDVGYELAKLQEMVDEAELRSQTPSDSPKIRDFKTLKITIKGILCSTSGKAVIVGFGLMTFQRLSGVSAVVYYTVDIFRSAGTKIKPETATIIVGVVSVIASCASALFVDRLGRRFLLIVSGTAMALSLAVMTLYFVFKDEGYSMVTLHLVPIVTLGVYIGFYGIGLGSIPWFYIDEIMPEESKNWGNSLINCQNWLTSFIVAKSFSPLADSIGFGPTFGILTVTCTMGVFFIYYYLPETQNRSFTDINHEISLLFVRKNVELLDNGENTLLE